MSRLHIPRSKIVKDTKEGDIIIHTYIYRTKLGDIEKAEISDFTVNE